MNKNLIIIVVILIVILALWQGAARFLPSFSNVNLPNGEQNVKLVNEQSGVVDVVKNVSPSVVTVGAINKNQNRDNLQNDPFDLFFNEPSPQPNTDQEEDYIGSGFVVDKKGLIITNKHVVSDSSLSYVVIDSKGDRYNVANIYRDPLNDVAILKISNPPAGGFKEISYGDSDKLQVGQFAIAIGTALGQFRNTVTTGVISGLGRGISAGSRFEGYAEQLDNVIQTDAAINPGNSGGPLLNDAGQVVGINTAVASSGQNVGFAIPINAVKQSIKDFNATGQFNRPFLGVSYVLINKNAALLNDLPEGALVRELIPDSPAEKAGVKVDDIITKIDGAKITDENSLAAIINKKKVGQSIKLTIFRDAKLSDIDVKLEQAQSH